MTLEVYFLVLATFCFSSSPWSRGLFNSACRWHISPSEKSCPEIASAWIKAFNQTPTLISSLQFFLRICQHIYNSGTQSTQSCCSCAAQDKSWRTGYRQARSSSIAWAAVDTKDAEGYSGRAPARRYPPNSAADFCVHTQVLGQDFSPKKADLVDPHGGSPGGCYP